MVADDVDRVALGMTGRAAVLVGGNEGEGLPVGGATPGSILLGAVVPDAHGGKRTGWGFAGGVMHTPR